MLIPKFLTEPDLKTIKKKSQKQEKRIANSLGGNMIAGSGSGRTKGDVNTKQFKIEAKRTDNKESISLKKLWLRKISVEAAEEGLRPAVVLEIDGEEWAIIKMNDLKTLEGYLNEYS